MKAKDMKVEIKRNIDRYIDEGLIKKGNYTNFVEFYLENAKRSLSTADALKQISENDQLKKQLKLLDDFETYLWVIVTSYYAMFYVVNALFARNNLKISDKLVHKVTSDAFYYYFIFNNKIAKSLFEIYEEAKEQVMDITQTKYPEEARRLAKDLDLERKKRGKFQYNMLESVKRSYAETSLKRAIEFVNQMEVIIKK